MLVPEKLNHIFEPTPLQCGQAVLAMLCNVSVDEIIDRVKTEKETTLSQMIDCLKEYGIEMSRQRNAAKDLSDLPSICVLSLETPKCWHWSLYCNGWFYDPEYGLINDWPPSNRRYYFCINI